MQSPSSLHRSSPSRYSSAVNDENTNNTTEELRRRRQRRRRRRPVSNNNNNNNSNDSMDTMLPSSQCRKNDTTNHQGSTSSSLPSSYSTSHHMPNIDDPFRIISLAVDHDEHKPNAIELLQVPLETGKLYHNEKLLSQALSRLRKEPRSFRLGWSMPFASSRNKRSKEKQKQNDHDDEDTTRTTTNDEHQHQQPPEKNQAKHSSRSAAAAAAAAATALTPVILSGLLATLDDSNFRAQSNNNSIQCACCAPANYQDSIQANTITTSSAELVNYTVAMRRAALARVRLRIKRERTHKIVKPVLAITTILCLYCYAWSSLQRLLVGFYGVTDIVFVTPTTTETSGSNSNSNSNSNDSNDVIELRVEMIRLITSSCRSRANADHYGYLSDYSKACRITEATTFELLTSPHNSRHTKLFARTAYDDINAEPEHEPERNANADAGALGSFTKFSAALMQYDDDYGDDTELPFYAMHTTLCDSESSIIPLEDVIHGARRQEREKRQKERWRRRRKRHQKYKQKQQQRNNDGFDGAENTSGDDIAAAHVTLSRAVEFWGDTTVNHLVREAIVEAHYKAAPTSSSSTKSIKGTSGSSSSSSSSSNKLKLLDVGSGLSGTLFSLCTPDFPFEDWSYHGIAISQPEVRRAKQLVDTVVRPIISSASASLSLSKTESSPTTESGDRSIVPKSFPISNITIQRASFDDPLPPKEYTTMVAIESLAFSHNITKTLMNLARSLKPKGTLIVIEDVVAPWAVVAKSANDDGDSSDSDDKDYVKTMAKLSGKPSLLTHDQWLEHFAAADLDLHRPPRDLLLEFDAWSLNTPSTTTATAVTGLPFVGLLIGERPWYSTGHGVLKILIDWFGSRRGDGGVEDDDDGNLSNRALSLMEDMMKNEQGNAYRRAAHHRADLGYYMYVCTKRS